MPAHQSSVNSFDFITNEATIVVVFAYLRKYGCFDFNVKWDDLITIISQYINDNKSVKIGEKNIFIDVNSKKRIDYIDVIDKQLIVAVETGPISSQMYACINCTLYVE